MVNWKTGILIRKTMNKLLVISGPTATGKTDLAVKLAKKYNGELISADSRQIYRGMDIGTGKDQPQGVNLHLLDLINPDESFSVAQFQALALQKISDIQSKGKLPIIVGGTGFYLESIITPDKSTYSIKPNNFLRFFLNRLSTPILQKIYKFLDQKSFSSLNNSEQHNPHRLIRKIEIKITLFFNKIIFYPSLSKEGTGVDLDILHLSLTAPNDFLYQRINTRVDKRLKLGLLSEIKKLLKKYSWSDPGLNTLAYKEFEDYFSGKLTLAQVEKKWAFDEHAYARRQKTWFKKQKNLHFIDITDPNFPQTAFELFQKWYNLS